MKIRPKRTSLKDNRGVVIIVVTLCLVLLVGMAALAIDIGYVYATRTELQNVADAAALAGARYMGEEYSKLSLSAMGTHEFTKAEVAAVIEDVANKNHAGNSSISIKADDIEIGLWDPAKSEEDIWYPTLIGPDAVRVVARRDSSINTPISTFFARVFNINAAEVNSNKAVAALSGPSFVDEGELKTPFGLSANNFPNDCKPVIAFSPTTDSCAGWHNFFDPINSSNMESKLLGLIQGDTQSYGTLWNGPKWLEYNFDINKTPSPEVTPIVTAGDEFNFQGGTISSLFLGGYLGADYNGNFGTVYGNEKQPAPMIALFDYFRYRDGDGDDSVWTATIPVYKDDPNSCLNPNKAIEILGFARIVVFSPDPPPLSSLKVHVDCNFTIIEGRGGGTTYGNLKGTIPNLVK